MDSRLLRMFQAVARHEGLAGAARELHLTASALSHRLKALETELGCRLFERSGRRMILNQAGEQLLAGIEQPLASLAATAARIRDLGRWGQGRMRLGIPTSLGRWLPPVVVELRRQFPKLHIVVDCGEFGSLARRIRDRDLDVAVGVAGEEEVGLETAGVFEDELLWVMHPAHPWVDGRVLGKSELRREPMIAHRGDGATQRLLDRHFARLGFVPSVVIEVGCSRMLKALVAAGQGVGVLAPWEIADERGRGELAYRAMGPRGVRRPWIIAHAAGRRLTLAEEVFRRLLAQEAARWPLDRQVLEVAEAPSSGRGRVEG